MEPAVDLSSNDAHVLTALFDPESSPTSTLRLDSSLSPYPGIEEDTVSELRKVELAAIRPLNVTSPSESAIQASIADLSKIITREPQYASAYANRAQVRRLVIGDDLFADGAAQDIQDQTEMLFSDLEVCIQNASPASPSSALAPQQAKLLAAAHTHRGYLLMKAATAAKDSVLMKAPAEVQGKSPDELEEMASKDFFLGGRYGDRTARDMSVRTNPYAKMCGAIVKEAMKKEREEFMAAH